MSEAAAPIKLVTLLKRLPGMTMDEFVDRYETFHARLGERFLVGHASRYFRRYLRSWPQQDDGVDRPHDVIMEIWFPDAEAFERAMGALGDPEIAAEIAADEKRTFDRSRTLHSLVDEHESILPICVNS